MFKKHFPSDRMFIDAYNNKQALDSLNAILMFVISDYAENLARKFGIDGAEVMDRVQDRIQIGNWNGNTTLLDLGPETPVDIIAAHILAQDGSSDECVLRSDTRGAGYVRNTTLNISRGVSKRDGERRVALKKKWTIEETVSQQDAVDARLDVEVHFRKLPTALHRQIVKAHGYDGKTYPAIEGDFNIPAHKSRRIWKESKDILNREAQMT